MVVETESCNLPWVEKYRPQHLSDLISHEEIINTIDRFIKEGSLPHLLFYGPPGTGKTSTILACARQLYKPREYQSMVLELNASDDRGIGTVRNQIHNFASTRTIFSSGFKLIVLDEADAMTRDAQDALRRIIEKFTDNVRFCLICNYLSKITPAIQSRCTRFRFAPLAAGQISPRLQIVVDAEKVDITEDGKQALLDLSGGDMRRVLNILQATWMSVSSSTPSSKGGRVDSDSVHACVGHPLQSDITAILNWMLNEDISTANQRITQLKITKGLALQDIISELHNLTHRVEFPDGVKSRLLYQLAEIEHHLCRGGSEQLQQGALIAAYQLAKHNVAQLAA